MLLFPILLFPRTPIKLRPTLTLFPSKTTNLYRKSLKAPTLDNCLIIEKVRLEKKKSLVKKKELKDDFYI